MKKTSILSLLVLMAIIGTTIYLYIEYLPIRGIGDCSVNYEETKEFIGVPANSDDALSKVCSYYNSQKEKIYYEVIENCTMLLSNNQNVTLIAKYKTQSTSNFGTFVPGWYIVIAKLPDVEPFNFGISDKGYIIKKTVTPC